MSLTGYLNKRLKRIFNLKEIKAEVNLSQPGKRLSGRKVIITGGGSGLGLAMARKLIDEGAEVLICGRNVEKLQKVSESIGCKYKRLDLTEVADFSEFIDEAFQDMGYCDILVNNAGISLHENGFLSVTEDSFDRQIATNFKGPFFLTQAFVSKYVSSRLTDGKILFVSSETGETADVRPYGLTKSAVNSLVKGLASSLFEKGIRINAIAPGVTASEMTGLTSEGDLTYPDNPSGRAYLPEEMAEVACFLLSNEANLINGQIIVCNEGKTINARWK